MEFLIDFNRKEIKKQYKNKFLKLLGAKKEKDNYFYIEIEDLNQLAKLDQRVQILSDYKLSMIVGFDYNSIYLDNV